MKFCTNCGHQLGVGRYCTNCGARVPSIPVDAPRHQPDYPTAVRTDAFPAIPAVAPLDPADPTAPPPPPPPGPPPSSARYPLYADTVQPPAAGAPAAPAATASYGAVPPRRRSATPWLFAVLALVVIALLGGGLLLLGPSDDDADASRGSGRGNGPQGGPTTALEPADIAVPDTASASTDEDGNRVTFKAANMLDGDPRTSWRMSGDGTGSVITLTFDDPVTVAEVGLINGYAKTDPPHDWYAGNRRITLVVWAFDDGTEVTQELGDAQTVQTVPVGGVETTSIELRILEVTAPGEGPDGRDYTAISEIELAGPVGAGSP